MDGIPAAAVFPPRSRVNREMPLLNRAQMDGGGSGVVTSDPGCDVAAALSAHEVSLMSKSQLNAGLTHRLSLNSSHDTWLPVSDMKSNTQRHTHTALCPG